MILGDGQWLFLLETLDNRTANFVTNQWEGENYEMFSLTLRSRILRSCTNGCGRTGHTLSRWWITAPADCSSNSRIPTATSLMFGRMRPRADQSNRKNGKASAGLNEPEVLPFYCRDSDWKWRHFTTSNEYRTGRSVVQGWWSYAPLAFTIGNIRVKCQMR